jgi:hypothetical protein
MLTVPCKGCNNMVNQLSGTPYASPHVAVNVRTRLPHSTPTPTPPATPKSLPGSATPTLTLTPTPVLYPMPPEYSAGLIRVEILGNQAFGKSWSSPWTKEFYKVLDQVIDLSVGSPVYTDTVWLKEDFRMGIELFYEPKIEEALEELDILQEKIQ